MNWKVIIQCIIMSLWIIHSASAKEVKSLSRTQFAHKLRQIIIDNDIEAFDKFHIGQLRNDGTRGESFSLLVEDEYYYRNYIFNTDKSSYSIRQFLLAQETAIYIDQYGDIIYYIPQKIKFPGEYTEGQHRQCWNVCYIQTDIDLVDGKWRIPSTAFYSERHMPWADEYG